MAEAFLFSVAKSLSLSLTSYLNEQLTLVWGVDSEIRKLEGTVRAINAILRDYEKIPRRTLSNIDQDSLTKLRNAVYEADDVFDKIVTRAKMKRLMEGNAFQKEVKLFFSSSNQLFTSISLAERIKSIRQSLDEISKDKSDFGDIINHPVEEAVQGECGNLSDNVVGREKEKNKIISMLLDSSFEETVCVIPIVGIGGLGKSTLARHVFNDEKVKENFNLRLWVLLPQDVTLKGVMEKIVIATGDDESNFCSVEQLRIRLSGLTYGKKYLLVLDNVWNEDVTEWRELEQVLTVGATPGSRILLTTRKPTIAQIMGTVMSFEFQSLEDGHSWSLLENLVFGRKGCQDSNLKEIGLKILPMCYNVPLAIRALAGVLATNISVSSWSRFQNDTMSNLASHDKSYQIMPILQLSYDYLNPVMLKSCFAFCSLFPREYEFDKDKLIILWIAQGFIEPLHRGGTLENEGAEYLDKLLNKGLLQHVPNNESHTKCKLHDLMYDLSCSVAAEQCQLLKFRDDDNVKSSIYHISFGYEVNRYTSLKIPSSLQSIGKLRTFLLMESPTSRGHTSGSFCKNLMTSFLYLRVLDLNYLGIKKLPKLLGKLIHLRYLDLSGNDFERLPKSITLLNNLQYLDLRYCWKLIELPKDMKKLVNLRHRLLLNFRDTNIQYFPLGLERLTNLQSLNAYVVGDKWDQKIQCIAANKLSKHGRLSDLNISTI